MPSGRSRASAIIGTPAPAAGATARKSGQRRSTIKFLRMKPGHGEVVLAEGDPRAPAEEELLIEEFRRQLDAGMWAAVPTEQTGSGRREAQMVRDWKDVPSDADRVIFFPRASGGSR